MSDIAPLTQGDPDAVFWENWLKDEKFLLQRCDVCTRHEWPATCCPAHGLAPMRWVETPGAGTVDTFTIFHRAYSKELAADVPYVVAVIRLNEGPYFHTRIVGCPPEHVSTGMSVCVRRGKADSFPLFIPV